MNVATVTAEQPSDDENDKACAAKYSPHHCSVHPNAAAVVRAITKDDLKGVAEALATLNASTKMLLSVPLNEFRWQMVHYAAANDAFRVMEWCVDNNANLDIATPDNGWTALHYAAYNGAERICSLLRHAGASMEIRDQVGDRACDVARLLGLEKIAEMLGDDSVAKAIKQKEQEELDNMIREARAVEEERARKIVKEEEAKREAEERARRRKERIQRNKEVRVQLERDRLVIVEEHFETREAIERDAIEEREWYTYSFLLVAHDILMIPLRMPPPITPVQQANVSAISNSPPPKTKKGKGSKKKRASPKSTPADSKPPKPDSKAANGTAPLSPAAVSIGAMSAARRSTALSSDSFALAGPMTKKKRSELMALRLKQQQELQARLAEQKRLQEEHQLQCEAEQHQLFEVEVKGRQVVLEEWQLATAEALQQDPTLDRRHTGDYTQHTQDCHCNGLGCSPGAFSWTCCGRGDLDALGCEAVDDNMRPPRHPGRYTYHLPDCSCGDAAALEGRVPCCNPGGFVWSCCGSQQADSEGCVLHKRFLYGSNGLLEQHFVTSQSASLRLHKDATACTHSLEYSEHSDNAMTRETVYGDTPLVSKSVVCYEVVIGECPLPRKGIGERMVIGIVVRDPDQADIPLLQHQKDEEEHRQQVTEFLQNRMRARTASGVGTASAVAGGTKKPKKEKQKLPRPSCSIAASDPKLTPGEVQSLSDRMRGEFVSCAFGIGWWSRSTQIRGMGHSVEADEPYGPRDIIGVVVDDENKMLTFYRNRNPVASLPIDTSLTYVPAITLIAGCSVYIDTDFKRSSLAYVDAYMKEKSLADRRFRLANFGLGRQKNMEYAAMFLQLKRKRSFRGGGASGVLSGAQDDEEDDGRIRFDV